LWHHTCYIWVDGQKALNHICLHKTMLMREEIDLTQNRDQWRALVDTMMNLWVP
jgi:hypothetical protein